MSFHFRFGRYTHSFFLSSSFFFFSFSPSRQGMSRKVALLKETRGAGSSPREEEPCPRGRCVAVRRRCLRLQCMHPLGPSPGAYIPGLPSASRRSFRTRAVRLYGDARIIRGAELSSSRSCRSLICNYVRCTGATSCSSDEWNLILTGDSPIATAIFHTRAVGTIASKPYNEYRCCELIFPRFSRTGRILQAYASYFFGKRLSTCRCSGTVRQSGALA